MSEMSKPEAMTKLHISILKNYVEKFLDEILLIKYIHIIPLEVNKDDKARKGKQIEIISEQDLREIQANLLFIVDNFKINLREVIPQKNPIVFKTNSFKELTTNILNSTRELKKKLIDYKKKIQEKNEKVKSMLISMELHKLLQEYSINPINIESLSLFNFVGFFGTKTDVNNLFITISTIPGLDSLVFQTKNISFNNIDYITGFCFVDKSISLTLNNRIEEGNCKIITFNPKYFNSTEFDSKILQNDINNEREEIEQMIKEIEQIKKEKIHELTAFLEISDNLELVLKLEEKFYVTKKQNIANIDAFIPTQYESEIVTRLNRKFGSNIRIIAHRIERELVEEENGSTKESDSTISAEATLNEENELFVLREKKEVIKTTEKIKPPTLVKYNRFIRPFRLLVDLYGKPDYAEMDPTVFVAITFPLFFGLMFGDIGHGLILVFFGLYLYFSRKFDNTMKDFGLIVFYCGLGSIIGGFLYGEIFGQELIINGQAIILLAKPMERFTFLLKFVVLIGVIHLSLGWAIKFYNFWTNKRKYLAIADPLLKILGLVGGTYLIFTYMFDISLWLTPQLGLFGLYYMPFLYPAVPGIVLVFSKLLGKIFHVPYLKKESAGSLFGEGVIETGETYLGILSNVASYSRLLALALAHIGFMVVVEQMALMMPGILKYFMFFFGNLFVVLIEAILSGIQALRLHLYEFFGKFYLADGYQFEAIELFNRYSKIEFTPLEKSIDLKE